jgi:hypothetical protein
MSHVKVAYGNTRAAVNMCHPDGGFARGNLAVPAQLTWAVLASRNVHTSTRVVSAALCFTNDRFMDLKFNFAKGRYLIKNTFIPNKLCRLHVY